MKVCPNNALHPAFVQAGLEGLWTPVLVPRIGYCEPNCVLCGQVCPTGAIWELTEAEKLGSAGTAPAENTGAGAGGPAAGSASPNADPAAGAPVKIGTAFYDRGRCLPWAMATECIVCEEWCPTSPKAITLQPADVVDSQGAVVSVRQPSVDPRALHRLRRVRVRLPGPGPAGDLRHLDRRDALPDQPVHPAAGAETDVEPV